MATTVEKRQTRGKHISDARSIRDKAQAEKRDMSGQELEQVNGLLDQADTLDREIKAEESRNALDKRLEDAGRSLEERSGRRTEPDEPNAGRGREAGSERRGNEPSEFRYKLPRNPTVERVFTLAGHRASAGYNKAFARYLRGGNMELSGDERRDMVADSDPDGGFLNAPQQFVAKLIQAVDDAVIIRQFATVIPLPQAESLGVPTLDTDLDDADWTSETETGSDDDIKVGKRELKPQPIAKRVKISRKLLRTAAIDPETLVRQRLAYKFGVTQEKAFMTGTGANQPLGIFTAHNDGISTGRDVSEGNTPTTITYDGLVAAKYSLKSAYWKNARWIFHRLAVKQLALIKDGTGRPIWREGLVTGEPDMLLDFPIHASEFAPQTFTTGQYAGIVGDFQHYWIAEALNLEIQRLNELYAEANKIGFIGRAELDGAPTLEEAFARVKLG